MVHSWQLHFCLYPAPPKILHILIQTISLFCIIRAFVATAFLLLSCSAYIIA